MLAITSGHGGAVGAPPSAGVGGPVAPPGTYPAAAGAVRESFAQRAATGDPPAGSAGKRDAAASPALADRAAGGTGPRPEPSSEKRPRVLTYAVQPGDTLWHLAERFGTSADTLLAVNPDVSPERMRPGQELRILANVTGTLHTVRQGETLSGIASRYGVSVERIAEANQLVPDDPLHAGQELIVPGARLRVQVASRGGGRENEAGWMWPLRGRVTSLFGMRWGNDFHPGIDIGAPTGATVVAARGGLVVSAGWDGGYGLSVVIDHGGGVRTRYAHGSSLLVRSGQRVEQGQPVLRVGSTGFSTGPHLHFEILIGGRAVDPLRYLP